jgi:hypothetical protein
MMNIFKSGLVASAILALLSGCGQQSFEAVHTEQQSDAPGAFSIAPKVDIVMVVDNSGSTYEIQPQLNRAITGFLTGLRAKDWNFRVTAMPLVGTPIYSGWAGSHEAGTVSLDAFRANPGPVATGGKEPGLQNIASFLALSSVKQNFLRSDASLAIVVIGNGNDTSETTYDPYHFPSIYTPTTVGASLIQSIRSAKSGALASQVHLFPVVSAGSSNCLGGPAADGYRYVNAGSQLGGHGRIELCSANMESVLAQLSEQLKSISVSYVKRYVLVDAKPNLATVKMTKHLAGGGTVVVPESTGGDGWKFLGQANVPMISEPVEMDFRTGWAFQLIGEAYKLTGSEYMTVQFLPEGVSSSP